MLPEKERNSAQKLLELLKTEELLALANTTTNKRIVVQTRAEAIEAIVIYSESSMVLLNRKRLSKNVLFQYLAGDGIMVNVMGLKSHFIEKTLEHWGVSQTHAPAAATPMQQKECQSSGDQTNLTKEEDSEKEDSQESRESDGLEGQEMCQEMVQATNTSSYQSNNQLAVQFVTWFYNMLNAYRPATNDDEFGVQHFYDDCTLRLLYSTYEQSVDEFTGARVVCDRLRAFVCEEQLQFNANTDSDGIVGLSDPHGLKVVVVCGTVHANTQVVGIFEQQFGLVRDPNMDNNWRIKFTNLKLLSNIPQNRLTLQETEKMMTIVPMNSSFQVAKYIAV